MAAGTGRKWSWFALLVCTGMLCSCLPEQTAAPDTIESPQPAVTAAPVTPEVGLSPTAIAETISAPVNPAASPTAQPGVVRTAVTDEERIRKFYNYREFCRKHSPGEEPPAFITNVQNESLPVTVHPSCHFDSEYIIEPTMIVIHFTTGSLHSTLEAFRSGGSRQSAHYVIDRDGMVYQIVPENLLARHISNKIVQKSIGIELVNYGFLMGTDPAKLTTKRGEEFKGELFTYEGKLDDRVMYRYWENFTGAQMTSLELLLDDIRARLPIPVENVKGHRDLEPASDPGPALDEFLELYRSKNP